MRLLRRGSVGGGRGRRGIALALVMVALAVAFTLGLAFLSRAATLTGSVQTLSDHAVARQIARTGLVMTLHYIDTHPDWHSQREPGTWVKDYGFGGGTFTIKAENEDGGSELSDPVTLVSVGRYQEGSHRLERVVPIVAAAAVGIATSGSQQVSDSRTDGYNSDDGSYGSTNMGEEVVREEGLSLPPPPGWPNEVPSSSEGDYEVDGGIHYITSHRHIDEFEIEDGAVVRIEGDVVIRVNDDFEMDDGGVIELLDDATLRLYVGGDIEIEEGSLINANTQQPWRVVIHQLENENFVVENDSEIHAILDATASTIEFHDSAKLYGAAMSAGFELGDSSRFRHDRNSRLLEANPRLPAAEEED